jgi:hypothetical protein
MGDVIMRKGGGGDSEEQLGSLCPIPGPQQEAASGPVTV